MRTKFKLIANTNCGKIKATIIARSFKEAKRILVRGACCTENQIVSCIIPIPTIREIREAMGDKGELYFCRKTMKFFGQRLSDFKVTRETESTFRISAPIYKSNRKPTGSYSVKIFDALTNNWKSGN